MTHHLADHLVIFPNVFFSNHHLAEHHCPENALSRTKITSQSNHDCDWYCYWYVTLVVSWIKRYEFVKSHREEKKKMTFGQMIFRENDVRVNDDSWNWRSVIRRFGKTSFSWTSIRLCNNSVKLRSVMFFFSARQRFGKMTFRENDVAPKNSK